MSHKTNIFGQIKRSVIASHTDLPQDQSVSNKMAKLVIPKSISDARTITLDDENGQEFSLPVGSIIKGWVVKKSGSASDKAKVLCGYVAENVFGDFAKQYASRVADQDHPVTVERFGSSDSIYLEDSHSTSDGVARGESLIVKPAVTFLEGGANPADFTFYVEYCVPQ